MALVSTAQLTITDHNDYIFTGTTPPPNPIANVTLWIDISVTPSLQKRWTGTAWEIVNEVKLGARNLLLDSGKETTLSAYFIKRMFFSYALTPSSKYTLVVKALASGTQRVGVWWNNGVLTAIIFERVDHVNPNVYVAHLTSPQSIVNQYLNFYNFPSSSTSMTIYYACLYEGHITPPLDWTPAPEDTQSQLDDIANDNKFTPDEKQSIKKEWDIIQGEQSRLISQADSLSVSRTVFAAVYSTLNSYITPLLSNLNTTSDIVGSTFRNNFTNYYNARTDLQNAIATKIQANLDGLQVGGENIADKTHIYFGTSTFNWAHERIRGNYSTTPIPGAYLKNNQEHVLTISEAIKHVGPATQYMVLLYDYTTDAESFHSNYPFSSSKRVVKFTTPASGNWSLLIYAGVAGATAGNSVEYKGIMLQEGNRETAYQTALKYLNEALANDGVQTPGVDIGLLFSKIIQMRDSQGVVHSGLSGLDDNIGFWTGGTYADALAGLAKIILRKDGSGQLAGNGVNWNTAGDLHVEGIISNKYEKLFIPSTGALLVNNTVAFGTYFLKSGVSNTGNINIDLSGSALLKEGSEFTFVVNNKKTLGGASPLYAVKLTLLGLEIIGVGTYADGDTEINIIAGGFMSLSIVYFDGKFIVSNLVHKTGTLASGHVNSDGYHLYLWGEKAKTGNAEIISTGRYRVPIKMHHSRYMVNLTAKESNRVVRFGIPGLNYFDVYVTDLNANAVSGGFVYSVFGDD